MKNHYLLNILIICVFIFGCEKNPTEADLTQNIWNLSTPEAQGMNPQILDSAFVHAKLKCFIDGLLVIRNGFIVAEEYYNGYNEFHEESKCNWKIFLSNNVYIEFCIHGYCLYSRRC